MADIFTGKIGRYSDASSWDFVPPPSPYWPAQSGTVMSGQSDKNAPFSGKYGTQKMIPGAPANAGEPTDRMMPILAGQEGSWKHALFRCRR